VKTLPVELPQKIDLDDGYFPLARTAVLTLAKTKLSGAQRSIIDVIFAQTYGYTDASSPHRQPVKKRRTKAPIAYEYFSAATWMGRTEVSRAINSLINWRIIGRDKNAVPYTYWFNVQVDDWSPACWRVSRLANSEQDSEPVNRIATMQQDSEPVNRIATMQQDSEPVNRIATMQQDSELVNRIATMQQDSEPVNRIATMQQDSELVNRIAAMQQDSEPVNRIANCEQDCQPVSRIANSEQDSEPVNTVQQDSELVNRIATMQQDSELVNRIATVQQDSQPGVNRIATMQQVSALEPQGLPGTLNKNINKINNNNNNYNHYDHHHSNSELATLFAEALGRPLSSYELNQLASWQEQIPAELLTEALNKAVLQGKATFAYINAILQDWKKHHVSTLAEVKQHDADFKNQKGRMIRGPTVTTAHTRNAGGLPAGVPELVTKRPPSAYDSIDFSKFEFPG